MYYEFICVLRDHQKAAFKLISVKVYCYDLPLQATTIMYKLCFFILFLYHTRFFMSIEDNLWRKEWESTNVLIEELAENMDELDDTSSL